MRVSVLIGESPLDLDVPAQLPIGLLIPMLWDIAAAALPELPRFELPLARDLHRPGRAALDPASTLAANDIRDGDTLILTARAPADPMVASVDPAAGFARGSTDTDSPVPPSVVGVAVVLLAAVAGITALPGRPAVETGLLTAGVTGAAAAVTARFTSPVSPALGAVALTGVLGAGAAAAVLATGGDLIQYGVLMVAVAIAVLAGAGQLTVILCATAFSASAAPQILSTLTGASAVSAGIAAPLLCVGGFDWSRGALALAASALLVLRARAPGPLFSRSALVLAAAICAAAALTTAPSSIPGIPVLALGLAGITVWFASRPRRPSPLTRRIADITERLLLAAVVPLSCWAFGLYGLVR